MTLSDLRQTTTTLIGVCEDVANGGHDEHLIENLRSDPFAVHLPTGFGPEVAHWIDAVTKASTMFRIGARKGEGPHAYAAMLGDLRYALDRLAAAVNAVKP